jgi:hypothetical protein
MNFSKNVVKAKEGIQGRIFGFLKNVHPAYLSTAQGADAIDNAFPDAQTKKLFMEMEMRRSEAIDIVRRLQNR